jgi:hypothetical protein
MAVISRFINPDTKKPITNVEVVRKTAKILKALENSSKPEDKVRFEKMINGEHSIAEWFYEVASIEDDEECQRRISASITPVAVRKQ